MNINNYLERLYADPDSAGDALRDAFIKINSLVDVLNDITGVTLSDVPDDTLDLISKALRLADEIEDSYVMDEYD